MIICLRFETNIGSWGPGPKMAEEQQNMRPWKSYNHGPSFVCCTSSLTASTSRAAAMTATRLLNLKNCMLFDGSDQMQETQEPHGPAIGIFGSFLWGTYPTTSQRKIKTNALMLQPRK